MSDIDINNDSVINFQLDERRARRMNLAKSALAATLDVADIGDAKILRFPGPILGGPLTAA